MTVTKTIRNFLTGVISRFSTRKERKFLRLVRNYPSRFMIYLNSTLGQQEIIAVEYPYILTELDKEDEKWMFLWRYEPNTILWPTVFFKKKCFLAIGALTGRKDSPELWEETLKDLLKTLPIMKAQLKLRGTIP